MVGKIHARRESRKTPGKKFGTTTYKKGGAVKKAKGGKVAKKQQLVEWPLKDITPDWMNPWAQDTQELQEAWREDAQ